MKLAISASDNTLNSMVDPRFGRAAWFLLVDSESGELLEAINNTQGREAAHGAGISAAAMLAEKGVQAVLTGRVGPKAMPVLEKAGIRAVNDVSGSVTDALASFNKDHGKSSPEQEAPSSPPPASGTGTGQRCGCGQGRGQGGGRGQGRGQGLGRCRR